MKKQVTLTALAIATAMTATAAQADDLKVGGKIFFDYSTDTATGSPNESGSNVTRTYLSAKKKLDDTWSVALTFDSAYDGTIKKNNNVFLKKAQLTGKFSDAVKLKLGMIGTPWIGYQDKLNKHRYVAKSYVDTHHLDSSADAGIALAGKVGMFSYDIANINGGGYGNTAITEKTDLNTRFGIKPIKGLTLDLGYRVGYLGKFVAGTTENKNTLTQFLVTYGGKTDTLAYRVGLNTISNKVNDELANTSLTDTANELWAWVRAGEFGGYLRYEATNRDGVAIDEKRTVISADYFPSKNVILSLVSDSTTDKGGVSGTDVTTTGLFAQFKF